MTAFSKDEQFDHNYNYYILDKKDCIACLSHGGWRLLPPTIAKNKEKLEILTIFFDNLPRVNDIYNICHNFDKQGDISSIVNLNDYLNLYGVMSLRGLYTYDTYDFSFKKRPFFRVTIPPKELSLNDLPDDIKYIMEKLRINEISFAEDTLIPEKYINSL